VDDLKRVLSGLTHGGAVALFIERAGSGLTSRLTCPDFS